MVGLWSCQPHAARVTCTVCDVETNIRIHKNCRALGVGCYTGFLRNCVPVLKSGWALALFSRVKRHYWQRQ